MKKAVTKSKGACDSV